MPEIILKVSQKRTFTLEIVCVQVYVWGWVGVSLCVCVLLCNEPRVLSTELPLNYTLTPGICTKFFNMLVLELVFYS